MAVPEDEQPPVRSNPVARSSRATKAHRLTSSVEVVRVRGPDVAHLAEVQAQAIKEVLTWALSQHRTREHTHEQQHVEDRAA